MYCKQVIIWFFSHLKTDITFNNLCGSTDINRECEDFFKDIFNIMYDYELINLNTERPNFPGVDIGDYKNMIAFQITCKNDKSKIIHTLEEIQIHNLKKYFKSFKILILSKKKQYNFDNIKSLMNDLSFNPLTDIIDLEYLVNEINKCSLNKLELIAQYIQQQSSNPFSVQKPLFFGKTSQLSATDRIEEVYYEICNTITWEVFDRLRNTTLDTKIRREKLEPIFHISSLYDKISYFVTSTGSLINLPTEVQKHLSISNNLCLAAMEFEDTFFQQACPGDGFYTFVTREQYNGPQRDYWRDYVKETEGKLQKFIKTLEADFIVK